MFVQACRIRLAAPCPGVDLLDYCRRPSNEPNATRREKACQELKASDQSKMWSAHRWVPTDSLVCHGHYEVLFLGHDFLTVGPPQDEVASSNRHPYAGNGYAGLFLELPDGSVSEGLSGFPPRQGSTSSRLPEAHLFYERSETATRFRWGPEQVTGRKGVVAR